jgi:ABC-type transport system substrate-binding protein
MKKILLTTAALGFAAAMSAGVSTSMAAPIAPSGAQVNIATPNDDVVQVQRWRRGRWIGPAVGVGIGLGLLGAAAYPYGYGPGYYGPGYYGPGYGPGPGRCWVQTGPYRGQGYWTYC